MRRAEITQCDVRFTVQPLIKRTRNVRLANTCLASQHHHTALTQGGVTPPPQQQLDLLFSSVQRRQFASVHYLRAALHTARPHYLPNRHRLHPTFQRTGAEIAVTEKLSYETMRALADQHHPGLG